MKRPHRRFASQTLLLILYNALSGSGVNAQEPVVRANLVDEGSVWVGQRLTLVVELLAPGYFSSAASFDLPDPEGVLLMPPDRHPVVGNETLDDTLYTVQRHELGAWPMRAGEQSVPALTIRFSFKRHPLDTESTGATVTTAPIPFTVKVPPGAENLGTVISARHLEVQESWKPEPGTDDTQAGSAFTRTVTFTAPDVPGMVFPPFPAGQIDGVGVYAKRQVLDRDDRGSLTGVRRDEVTYVCQRPGRFTIPAVRFAWFDVDAGELRVEELPARTLSVVANPAMASAEPPGDTTPSFNPWTWTRVAVGMVLALLALVALQRIPVRRILGALAAPFRPVHLQPLNPAADAGGSRD